MTDIIDLFPIRAGKRTSKNGSYIFVIDILGTEMFLSWDNLHFKAMIHEKHYDKSIDVEKGNIESHLLKERKSVHTYIKQG